MKTNFVFQLNSLTEGGGNIELGMEEIELGVVGIAMEINSKLPKNVSVAVNK